MYPPNEQVESGSFGKSHHTLVQEDNLLRFWGMFGSLHWLKDPQKRPGQIVAGSAMGLRLTVRQKTETRPSAEAAGFQKER